MRGRGDGVGRKRGVLRGENRGAIELVVERGGAAEMDELGVAGIIEGDEFGEGRGQASDLVTAADAERGVRGVVAHEAQHIELRRRRETGRGAEPSKELRGGEDAVGVVKEGDGGRGAVFDQIFRRGDDGITDVREAGAGIEDRRVIGRCRPLPHEQPVS